MKTSKIIVSLILCASVLFAFAACKKAAVDEKTTDVRTETSVVEVTDKKGEPVTDESGEKVTEIVTVTVPADDSETKENGGKSSDGKTTEGKSSKKEKKSKKDKKDKKETTTKRKTIKKPDAPKTVTGLKVTKTSTDEISLSWNNMKCTGYHIDYYITSENDVHGIDVTDTKVTLKDLLSATKYTIEVYSYNENDAGRSTASKAAVIKAETKVNTDARKIKINIQLPMDSNSPDELTVTVKKKDADKDDEAEEFVEDVHCDGSVITVKTKEKYKGEVVIKASLKNEGTSVKQTSDKDEVTLVLSPGGTPIGDGGED